MRRRITSPTGLSLLIPLGVSLAVAAVLVALGAPAWDAVERTWWARVVFPTAFAPGIFLLDALHVRIPPSPLASLAMVTAVNVGLWFVALRAGFAAWSGLAGLARRRPASEKSNPFTWVFGDE